MNELVKSVNGENVTTSRVIADAFIGGKKDRYRDVNRSILFLLWDLGLKSHSGGYPSEIKPMQKDIIMAYKPLFENKVEFRDEISNAHFILTKEIDKRGKTVDTIIMNRDGYILVTMQLGRYENALLVQRNFIKDFMMEVK